MLPQSLRTSLIAAGAGAGAAAFAAIMGLFFEGTVYVPYYDPAGVLTVCEGITGPDVVPGKTYTDKECRTLHAKHLAIAERAVDRVIKVPLTETQKAALIDFTYNKGAHALAGSSLARKFNEGDYVGGCRQLLRWTYATVNGKKVQLPGLVTRAAAQYELCVYGLAID